MTDAGKMLTPDELADYDASVSEHPSKTIWSREEVAALLSHISALTARIDELERAQAWRPIGTLTREDGDVLWRCPGYRGKEHQMVGALTLGGEYRSWPSRHKYDPTDWQPLPAPPAK